MSDWYYDRRFLTATDDLAAVDFLVGAPGLGSDAPTIRLRISSAREWGGAGVMSLDCPVTIQNLYEALREYVAVMQKHQKVDEGGGLDWTGDDP